MRPTSLVVALLICILILETVDANELKKLRLQYKRTGIGALGGESANVTKNRGTSGTKKTKPRRSKSVAGTRTISLQTDQGFNGFTNFKPSGWRITETVEPSDYRSSSTAEEKVQVFIYPNGVGPALIGGCTGSNYAKSSPCYGTKQAASGRVACPNLMESASYIGVGFDGRGYYKIESRRASLVQRRCSKEATFKGRDVPDTMAVFGIYDTKTETKTFQSSKQYMSYIQQKAGVARQKEMFLEESYKERSGFNKKSSSFEQKKTMKSSTSQRSFFAILFINIIHYEISLDEVKPQDLNFAALKDYVNLPESYYSVGADAKYQDFLLRWGTHYIRSAKFGGQLKIKKTAKAEKSSMSEEQFSSIAESEFQSMFSTLKFKSPETSSSSSGWSFFGFGAWREVGHGRSESIEKDTRKSSYEKKMEENSRVSKNFRKSEFTHTTVEAQGGTPLIAEALLDFYTPAFKQLFHKWIASIKNFIKPFNFQLKSIGDLFNMNMDSLFPSGNTGFACMKGVETQVKIMTENGTNRRFYLDERVSIVNNKTIVTRKKVYCKYDSFEGFKMSLERHNMALETAVAVYMAEGPFPTTSEELDAGEKGCEKATRKRRDIFENITLSYEELKNGNLFFISFDLQDDLLDVAAAKGKYSLVFRADRWFAANPGGSIHLYGGCKLEGYSETQHKICFRNVILTYDEAFGMFTVEPQDFKTSKIKLPNLPDWLSGAMVAKASRLSNSRDSLSRESIPCNIRWLNSHRLDPNKATNCLHFTAASEGHMFVAFSSIPKDKMTWYYLMINIHGVEFYHAMRLTKRDTRNDIGTLGDKNLYENYFVCVIQLNGKVIMQYGKSDPDSDVGRVHSSHIFRQDSQYSRLSFYAFGAGSEAVSLMDIRRTKDMPKVNCLNSNETLVQVQGIGYCDPICHNECNECERARSDKACVRCRNVALKLDKVVQCLPMCPPGYTLSESSAGMCTKCEMGTFKSNSGNNNCTACSPGFYSSSTGAATCSKCHPGTYADQIGSKQCTFCPEGTFTGDVFGAKSCNPCRPGTFTDQVGSKECKNCPKGTSTHRNGSTSCIPCRSGSYAEEFGSRVCSDCPLGRDTKGYKGQTSCSKCSPGTYRGDIELDVCKHCPVGTDTRDLFGAASCTPCAPGTFANKTGARTCYPCPKGTYTPHSLSTECFKCPNDTRNSTGATRCSKCPPGRYGTHFDVGQCEQCNGNKYQPYKGTTFCFLCKKGWKSSKSRATKCIRCSKYELDKHSKQGQMCSGMLVMGEKYFESNRWARKSFNVTITGAEEWMEERKMADGRNSRREV